MLTMEERDQARAELIRNYQALVTELGRVRAEDWERSGTGWSAAQILEHLIRVERSTLGAIQTAPPSPETNQERDRLVGLARRRTRKVESPPFARPTGEPIPREELMGRFATARDASLAWLDDPLVDHRQHAQPHPFFGILDGYQWLLFLAAHGDRHLEQLKELAE